MITDTIHVTTFSLYTIVNHLLVRIRHGLFLLVGNYLYCYDAGHIHFI